jgi:hypothetical protein
VPKYKVCFDGKWQGDFDDRYEALYWAHEVGQTGRLVHVAEVRFLLHLKLIAVFPEDRADEGKWWWDVRGGKHSSMSIGDPPTRAPEPPTVPPGD